MEPYKVYMKSDLKKMILDIIKFDIIKERSVTELLFFNDFQPNIYHIWDGNYLFPTAYNIIKYLIISMVV